MKTQKQNIFQYSKRILIALVFVMLIPCLHGQDTTKNKFGKGIQVVAIDSSFAMKFGARFQSLYVGEYNYETENYNDGFLIRRFRLKFDGFAYHPSLVYKIELGFSNRDHGGGDIAEAGFSPRIILDAVLKWNFHKNWSVWFGQTKLPGNRERVISSQKLQFVDRSLLNSKFNIDRDIGIQLRHKNKIGAKGVMKQMFSVSIGEGRDIIVPNIGGYDYTARLEYLPFGEFESKGDYFSSDLKRESIPKLAFGVSYDLNKGASRQRGQLGRFMVNGDGTIVTNDLSTVFVDAIFKYNGFSFLGEYANKVGADDVFAVKDDLSTIKYLTGKGLNLQAGYLFKNNFEIATRYTKVTPDKLDFSGLGEEEQYTLGFSKYIVGHSLKVQTDVVYAERFSAYDKLYYRFQIEIAF
jgi:phosphate-selective porin OprO and OprP